MKTKFNSIVAVTGAILMATTAIARAEPSPARPRHAFYHASCVLRMAARMPARGSSGMMGIIIFWPKGTPAILINSPFDIAS